MDGSIEPVFLDKLKPDAARVLLVEIVEDSLPVLGKNDKATERYPCAGRPNGSGPRMGSALPAFSSSSAATTA